jgi:hypothetical protein
MASATSGANNPNLGAATASHTFESLMAGAEAEASFERTVHSLDLRLERLRTRRSQLEAAIAWAGGDSNSSRSVCEGSSEARSPLPVVVSPERLTMSHLRDDSSDGSLGQEYHQLAAAVARLRAAPGAPSVASDDSVDAAPVADVLERPAAPMRVYVDSGRAVRRLARDAEVAAAFSRASSKEARRATAALFAALESRPAAESGRRTVRLRVSAEERLSAMARRLPPAERERLVVALKGVLEDRNEEKRSGRSSARRPKRIPRASQSRVTPPSSSSSSLTKPREDSSPSSSSSSLTKPREDGAVASTREGLGASPSTTINGFEESLARAAAALEEARVTGASLRALGEESLEAVKRLSMVGRVLELPLEKLAESGLLV